MSSPVEPLEVAKLRWRCDEASLDFTTTDELADLDGVLGQSRAVDAIGFAIEMPHDGYNLFALGSQSLDKQSVVRRLVESAAKGREVPGDWCYLHNFDEPYRPKAVRFPAGNGRRFRDDMDAFVEALPDALKTAFQTEEYTTRRQMLEQALKDKQEETFSAVDKEARGRGVGLLRTPMGLTLAPVRDGKVVPPEAFEAMSDEERGKIEADIEELQEKLQEALRKIPEWMKEAHKNLQSLNEETADYAVGNLIDELRQRYAAVQRIDEHLTSIKQDIIVNVPVLLQVPGSTPGQAPGSQSAGPISMADGPGQAFALLRRYRANLIVDCSAVEEAPVVYEDEPTYDHLIGRIEHRAEMGALLTDFMLIRPGSLHRANGGFILLDARKLLTRPYAWDGLKRALQAGVLKIESLGQVLGLAATASLEPEPIPLNVKVALVGDRQIYYLLSGLDPDFQDLFKVAADFDEQVVRDAEATAAYARMIANLVRGNGLLPFGRAAVARVLEHGARLTEDSERLTMHTKSLADLLREADHHARAKGETVVGPEHVVSAQEAWERRNDRVRNLIQDEIRRGTFLIDSDGARVGQINGLSVMGLGGYTFGRPMRITARIHLGRGDVVDIDREVELGGPIHAKGVLILSSFLKARYAIDRPLSLGASLVFEQSYGGVEGDSASVAELTVLLSAIAEVPIDQSFAVTGSVNQHGQVQAIGGVNEKIEGFFDVCAARGLTGRQAVLIPASNVKHLMLHQRVLDAVEAGEFRIFAIDTVDHALALLTGMTAGEPDGEGRYPEDTFNRRVADRLAELIERRKAFAAEMKGEEQRNG
jgi:lon-related putative ATP-dependent protease